ncbi:MAG: class I SAM-dependent methyltransferase [Bacteroidota bacterium]
MNRLTEIGLKHFTDKAEHHEFTEFYQDYFERFQNPTLLEIGVLDGGSLRMYHEFWEGRAKIIGVDKQEKGMFNNHPNIKIVVGDILNNSTLEAIKKINNNEQFDIIIDDGGHMMQEQQETLINLWSSLKPGGIFIVEDLHTSGHIDFNPDRTTTTLTMLQELQNGNFLESRYVKAEQLKEIYPEMQDILIWDNSTPQAQMQIGKASITCVIIKASKAETELAKQIVESIGVTEETKETVNNELLELEKRTQTILNNKNEEQVVIQKTPDELQAEKEKKTLDLLKRQDESKEKVIELQKQNTPVPAGIQNKVLSDFYVSISKNPKFVKSINLYALDEAIKEFTGIQQK